MISRKKRTLKKLARIGFHNIIYVESEPKWIRRESRETIYNPMENGKKFRKYASNGKQRFTNKVDTQLLILMYALHCQKELVARARMCGV